MKGREREREEGKRPTEIKKQKAERMKSKKND